MIGPYARSTLQEALTPAALGAALVRSPALARSAVPVGRLRRLCRDVAQRRYRPGTLRRRTRQKPAGGTRMLEIPSPLDRALQVVVLDQLSRRVDGHLLPNVHGFRRGRSVATATRFLMHGLPTSRHLEIVQGDIVDLFPTIPHRSLERACARIWCDPTWRWLVAAWNRAWGSGGRGVPQGAPLSPLLANVFLGATLDRDLARWAADGSARPPLTQWVRYADDLVLVTAERGGGVRTLWRLQHILTRHRLSLQPRKSALHTPGATGLSRPFRMLGTGLSLSSAGDRWIISERSR